MTQGPWHVTHKPDGEYPVFDIGQKLENGDVNYVGEVSDPADAKLVAAAPELWSTLATIVATFDVMEDKPDVARVLAPLSSLIERARRALANANSETQ